MLLNAISLPIIFPLSWRSTFSCDDSHIKLYIINGFNTHDISLEREIGRWALVNEYFLNIEISAQNWKNFHRIGNIFSHVHAVSRTHESFCWLVCPLVTLLKFFPTFPAQPYATDAVVYTVYGLVKYYINRFQDEFWSFFKAFSSFYGFQSFSSYYGFVKM